MRSSIGGLERWYAARVGVGVGGVPEGSLTEPVVGQGEYEGFEFWNQLSDLTYGFVP